MLKFFKNHFTTLFIAGGLHQDQDEFDEQGN
jgi:hypothetical protein